MHQKHPPAKIAVAEPLGVGTVVATLAVDVVALTVGWPLLPHAAKVPASKKNRLRRNELGMDILNSDAMVIALIRREQRHSFNVGVKIA